MAPGDPNQAAAAPARPSRPATSAEGAAILAAAAALVLGVCGGLIAFQFNLEPPLFGGLSVGIVAALAASVCCAGAFIVSYRRSLRSGRSPWRDPVPIAKQILDIGALTLTHVGIVFLGTVGVYSVLQNAFLGLKLDPFAASALTGLTAAVCSYFVYLSATELTAYRVSNVLAIFLLSGALTSMLFADDPFWWQRNFSYLGQGFQLSAFWFNGTLVISGIVVTTLADYMTSELSDRDRALRGSVRRRTLVVRWGLVLGGLLLAGVGLIPVNLNNTIHTALSVAMIGVFALFMLVLPILVPGLARPFVVTTYLFVIAIVATGVLMQPVGYFNLTALELVAATIIFGWLVLFMRNIAASVSDDQEDRRRE